jgi:hypothetical protein
MKKSFFLCLLVFVFLGASCGSTGAPAETVSPAPVVSEKAEYQANLDLKLADLKAHMARVKEKRAGLSENSIGIFDQQVAALELHIAALEQALQGMKAAPESAFMEERAKVNEQLQTTEDLYLKIITDYKIEVVA